MPRGEIRQYEVTAFVDADTSVQEVSKIFEALTRLSDRGVIDFSIESRKARNCWPRVVALHARDENGTTRNAAIDLSDQRDLFDEDELRNANIYFKRSFWPDAARDLPEDQRAKVQPFGLNNPAIGRRAMFRLLRARMRTDRKAHGFMRDARQLAALPNPSAFECAPEQEAEPLVLFQTRLWDSEDPEFNAINEQRIALVRCLRKALGNRFIGGLIPTDHARRRHADFLTDLPYSMRSYPKVVRHALIGVYSQGLHRSIAFKMSEYLAASRCIVADRIDVLLPSSLEPGKHFLQFEDPNDCAARCDALLANSTAMREMRATNWNYYRQQLEPGAQLLNVLRRLFEH
jgi:Glycosyl transferases group 1